ncbi:MAG: hypothetical protein V4794_01185 [Pseudomonadota bacterium]
MSRYVLVLHGPGKRLKKDIGTIEKLSGVKVVNAEESSNVMVDEAKPSVKRVVNKMQGWRANEETTMAAPGPLRY